MSLEIFVSVGTDHHPFARLIAWVDAWVSAHPDVVLIVQHGSSPPSSVGRNQRMMAADELQERYRAADVVVSQVGPGTIADANSAGMVPIVVPRDPALGEVVDDHQYAYGEFMAAQGRCIAVTSEAGLHAALDEAASDPGSPRFRVEVDRASASAAVGELVAALVSGPRRPFSWRRVMVMLRRPAGPSSDAAAKD